MCSSGCFRNVMSILYWSTDTTFYVDSIFTTLVTHWANLVKRWIHFWHVATIILPFGGCDVAAALFSVTNFISIIMFAVFVNVLLTFLQGFGEVKKLFSCKFEHVSFGNIFDSFILYSRTQLLLHPRTHSILHSEHMERLNILWRNFLTSSLVSVWFRNNLSSDMQQGIKLFIECFGIQILASESSNKSSLQFKTIQRHVTYAAIEANLHARLPITHIIYSLEYTLHETESLHLH